MFNKLVQLFLITISMVITTTVIKALIKKAGLKVVLQLKVGLNLKKL